MTKLKWGMIGGGDGSQIGPAHRLGAGLDGLFEFTAGALDHRPEEGILYGQSLGLEDRAYGSWQDMLSGEKAQANPVDLVTVATPNSTHFEITKAFLEGGFHVLCEKPMTMTIEEGEEIVKISRATGKICAVNYGYSGYCEFMTDTRGTGVLNRVFHTWAPHKGAIPGRRAGVLISMENGSSVPYALFNLEDRGRFFIGSQEVVYQGMIIGEHNRENDLEVNPLKGKKLSNVRASGTDEAVRLTTPITMSLEEAIAYIDNDELVEVTPNAIRLRKIHLDPHERKRASRSA